MAHLDGPIQVHDDNHGPLTFGIELEFLVPALKPSREDTSPIDPRPIFRIEDYDPCEYRDQLNEFILPTLQEIKGIKVREETQDKFIPPHDNVPRYNVWRLVNDISVNAGDDPRYSAYEWVGKEVTSEILRTDDPGYAKKIGDMCRAIRNCRVHLNTSTGVHVHIGRGDDGFTLKTVKRLATMMWLLDLHIISLHHPCRWRNKHCELLRNMSKLAAYTNDQGHLIDPMASSIESMEEMHKNIPDDLLDFLLAKIRHIWVLDDLEELAHLMGNTSDPHARNPMRSAIRGTVGFRRFLSAGKTGGNINTLEFRQMAGTLDPEHILRWIKVCISIMDFARLSSDEAFKTMIGKVAKQGPKYSTADMLRDLSLETEIEFWENKVNLYRTGDVEGLQLYEGSEHDLFVPPM